MDSKIENELVLGKVSLRLSKTFFSSFNLLQVSVILEIASCIKLFYICSSPSSFSVPIKINFPF